MDECVKHLTKEQIMNEFGNNDDLGECNQCPNLIYNNGIMMCKLLNMNS